MDIAQIKVCSAFHRRALSTFEKKVYSYNLIDFSGNIDNELDQPKMNPQITYYNIDGLTIYIILTVSKIVYEEPDNLTIFPSIFY